MNYKIQVIEVRQTVVFQNRLRRLRDQRAIDLIVQRIARLERVFLETSSRSATGYQNFGSATGPGYRLYFVQRGSVLIVLLCGGDKQTQQRDIEKAHALANDLET